MLGDAFPNDVQITRAAGSGDTLVLQIAPSVIATVSLKSRRLAWTRGRQGDGPAIGSILGVDSEGPLFSSRWHPYTLIELTPAITGYATRDLIGLAEVLDRAGDTKSRNAINARVEDLLELLDEMSEVEIQGYTNKWQEMVWKRTVMLRHMHAGMIAARR